LVSIRSVGVVIGVIAVQVAWMAGAEVCPQMSMMAGATKARIAHLLGEDLPERRAPRSLVLLSLLGAIGAVWLVMCLGQGALAAIGV
jgi:hypothetical protein